MRRTHTHAHACIRHVLFGLKSWVMLTAETNNSRGSGAEERMTRTKENKKARSPSSFEMVIKCKEMLKLNKLTAIEKYHVKAIILTTNTITNCF